MYEQAEEEEHEPLAVKVERLERLLNMLAKAAQEIEAHSRRLDRLERETGLLR